MQSCIGFHVKSRQAIGQLVDVIGRCPDGRIRKRLVSEEKRGPALLPPAGR